MKILIVAAALANISLAIAAQATDLSGLGWVGNVSAAAVLGWYLYYDTRFGRPRSIELHNEHVERVQQNFHAELNRVRDDFAHHAKRLGEFYQALTVGGGFNHPSGVVGKDRGDAGDPGDRSQDARGGDAPLG